jgi:hypothetical protein
LSWGLAVGCGLTSRELALAVEKLVGWEAGAGSA